MLDMACNSAKDCVRHVQFCMHLGKNSTDNHEFINISVKNFKCYFVYGMQSFKPNLKALFENLTNCNRNIIL